MIEPGFFNKYPRFFKTARASKNPDRLNIRYQGLIERNKDLLVNKKILDLASHDGRWSFAALKAGAHSVIGIEGREELVKDAYENFRAYDTNPTRYKYFLGDISTVLNTKSFDVDVIFCFGFYYHTTLHVPLLASMKKHNPSCIILDTKISQSSDCVIELSMDDSSQAGHAISDSSTINKNTVVGKPSRLAINMLFNHFGYETEEIDWSIYIGDNDSVKDYRVGDRITLIARNIV